MENKKEKILVVDDEPDIVNVLKHFLSLKGYGVIGAYSAEEALTILEKESADLILLDMLMPGINGAELARIVKNKYPKIKLILVTAYSTEAKELSKESLLDGVFIKPVPLKELYSKLAETLCQDRALDTDLKQKQSIIARVILIKAKLLFLEPSMEIYNSLCTNFKQLSKNGKNYEMEVVSDSDEEKIIEKLSFFNPDILIANTSFLKAPDNGVLVKISERNSGSTSREVIVYNINDIKRMQDAENTELERLTNAVESTCLKHGLLEIKWVEI